MVAKTEGKKSIGDVITEVINNLTRLLIFCSYLCQLLYCCLNNLVKWLYIIIFATEKARFRQGVPIV
jgi:hypothetical protein